MNFRSYCTFEFGMIWKVILTGLRYELVPYVALVERIGKVDNGPHRQSHLHDRYWFFGRSMKHHQTPLWKEKRKVILIATAFDIFKILVINKRMKYLPILNSKFRGGSSDWLGCQAKTEFSGGFRRLHRHCYTCNELYNNYVFQLRSSTLYLMINT